MAYIDLNKSNPVFQAHQFDYTIIGAGVAGILLAVKLNERGKKVLLIESGHFGEDPQRQILNEVEQTAKTLENAIEGRKRAIGGTSIAWGGQSLPFSPMDFEPQSWIAESGWPIQYTDLEPYYPSANVFLGIDSLDYETDIFKLLHQQSIPFDDGLLYQHFSKWAPNPNLQRKFDDTLRNAPGITVLFNAVLIRIDLDESDRAYQIIVCNFNQQQYSIPIRQLVIAAGGLETNRILLANRHQKKTGIGNHSDWLGKCFMDHPCIEIGMLKAESSYRAQSKFNTHVHRRRKYSIRISFSEKARHKYELLHGSASVMFDYPGERFDPYAEVRYFLQNKKIRSLRSVLRNSRSYLLSLKALAQHKFIYKHKAEARVTLMMEQEPLRESYIGLSTEADLFGVPKALINWKISPKSWYSTCEMAGFLQDEFQRLSLGEIVLHPNITLSNQQWESAFSDVNHHMGGTRMSADPENGVVNSNLQVWGHDNIYVCSTSVFPTSSHSNPTLTMMALALRWVDQQS